MISEFRKSINSILFERMSSPFYGAFISSWIVWNWKIIYLTIFISESKIEKSKIDYIVDHYSNICHLIGYPLISTIIVLLILPFLTNGAYWTSLKFKNWRKVQMNNIEKKQLLTVEQSIAIRKELKEKDLEYEAILQKREKQIANLNQIISNLENENIKLSKLSKKKENKHDDISPDYKKLKANKVAFEYFQESYKSVEKTNKLPSNISELARQYYTFNEIFSLYQDNSISKYDLTKKSNVCHKQYLNEKYSSKDETEGFV